MKLYYLGEQIDVISKEEVEELIFVDWIISDDCVQYTIFRDEDTYYAVEGEE